MKYMKTIKRIDPFSLAKIQAFIFAVLSLVMVAGIGLFAFGVTSFGGAGIKAALPFLVPIVLLPVVYGLMGFVMGYIAAWAYNLIAKVVGGIQIDLE